MKYRRILQMMETGRLTSDQEKACKDYLRGKEIMVVSRDADTLISAYLKLTGLKNFPEESRETGMIRSLHEMAVRAGEKFETLIDMEAEGFVFPEDEDRVQNFRNGRVSFAVSEEGTVFNVFAKDCSIIDSLCNTHGMSRERALSLVRGFIKPGRICFYTGEEFAPAPLTEEIINAACSEYIRYFRGDSFAVYNGIHMGIPGEEWTPMQHIGYYTLKWAGNTGNDFVGGVYTPFEELLD